MGLKVANNAYGLLAAGISDSDTVIALQSGHGARFGTFDAAAADYMFATLLNASNQLEIVKITARTTDSLTVSRGEDGTTPLAYSSGDRLEARPCAGVVNDLLALITAIWTTGDAKLTLKTVADAGWVLANDGTIGNAASGATTRANADTEALFTLLWDNIIDTWCAVSGGRGASAAADFAANKTIALPKAVGRALAVFGTGAGLTARVLGEILGSESVAAGVTGGHALTIDEMPSHTHTDASGAGAIGQSGTSGIPQRVAGTTGATGGGAAHDHTTPAHSLMSPYSFWNAMVKL